MGTKATGAMVVGLYLSCYNKRRGGHDDDT
jgi:hypothetical protein